MRAKRFMNYLPEARVGENRNPSVSVGPKEPGAPQPVRSLLLPALRAAA